MEENNTVDLGKDQEQNEQTSQVNNEQQSSQNNQGAYNPQGNWQNTRYNYQPYMQYNNGMLTTEEKVMCAVGYFGILVLIPILAINNKKQFVKAHINCALSLWIWGMIGIIILIPSMLASTPLWFNENTFVLGFAVYMGILALTLIYSIVLGIAQVVNLVFAAVGRDAKLPVLKTFKFYK